MSQSVASSVDLAEAVNPSFKLETDRIAAVGERQMEQVEQGHVGVERESNTCRFGTLQGGLQNIVTMPFALERPNRLQFRSPALGQEEPILAALQFDWYFPFLDSLLRDVFPKRFRREDCGYYRDEGHNGDIGRHG